MHNDGPHDPRTLLDGWRDSGADRADPVCFRFIETMAQRAAVVQAHYGRGRVLLFANNPLWRGETIGSYALVLNALTEAASR